MPITSFNDYVASNKQRAIMTKVATRTTIAAVPFSVFDLAGSPGPGPLAGTNATTGVVPVDADVGYPTLIDFVAGATGNVSRLAFSSSLACRLSFYDRLWVIGALPFNANVAVTGAPSFAARLPGGNFRNTELWLETVTAFTGNQTVTITYTNELGVAGRTSTLALGVAPTVGRCTQMPLQAGDNGVQSVQNITSTVSTAGTFNVMILRSLLADGVRVRSTNDGDTFDMARTGLLPIYDNTALYMMVTPDSTNTGLPSVSLEIASK